MTGLKSSSGGTLVIGAGAAQRVSDEVAGTPANLDALGVLALGKLTAFTDWCDTHAVDGYLGEVGWPRSADNTEWQRIGSAVYAAAQAAGLTVTYWATGEKWSQTYNLLAYNGVPVSNSFPQATVIEGATLPQARGINVAGGEFTQSGFAAGTPGTYGTAGGTAYHYSTQATYTHLAGRGVTLVRIPFRWERLQPTLNAALDTTELGRLQTAVGYAATAGLDVILDCHNYGGYYLAGPTLARIGSASLPVSSFADFWQRMATAFGADPTVVAYGLTNEPGGFSEPGPIYSNEHTLYSFDANITGWSAPQGEVWSSSQGGSMRVTPATSSATSAESDNSLRDRSANGISFWADVYIESGAAGNWDVALQTQNAAFGFIRNGFTRLTKGQVTRLRLDLTLSQAQAMRGLGISWGGTGRNGTDFAYVTGVSQGTYTSSGTVVDLWESASQQATAAIRTVDSTTPVAVACYLVDGEEPFGETHTVPWIDDDHVLYEMHLYFDYPASGIYPDSYATDLAAVT